MAESMLIIDTQREGYGIDQIKNTMTVGDLMRYLEDFDEDTPIYLGFDNRYTYGGITERKISEEYFEEDDIEDDYYE